MNPGYHVAVLAGGRSAERAVSLETGTNVTQALERRGHHVKMIDVKDEAAALIEHLNPRPDIAFNALHGRYGEDGCIQGLLEWMDIPYTHSGVLASAVAMNKPMAKALFTQVGIACPQHILASRDDFADGDPMPRPYVIKPLDEGSSVGVRIIGGDDPGPSQADWPESGPLMVEAYAPGRELTVAILDDEALGVLEIHPQEGFYDYRAKYQAVARHSVPALIPDVVTKRALDDALRGHHVLGCQGVSRADFRYDETTDSLLMLEINTQPGMTSASLLPEIAAWRGIEYDELVERLLKTAQMQPRSPEQSLSAALS